MNKALIIRKVGNSLCLTITTIAKELGLGAGGKVYAIRTPRGFEIVPYDTKFAGAVDMARGFMGKYSKAMKKLAE